MSKCSICDKIAVFKIKDEPIYYCKEHAVEFFDIDALELISNRIKTNEGQARILKKFLEEN